MIKSAIISSFGFQENWYQYWFTKGLSYGFDSSYLLEIAPNNGFWSAQNLSIPYRTRIETDIRGVGRDISTFVSIKSKLIHPFTINTMYIDYSLRKKVY